MSTTRAVRIKEIRDKECRKKRGYEYEYDPTIPLNGPLNPFAPIDCKVQSVPGKSVDHTQRVIKTADTQYRCEKLNGRWSSNSVNRHNTRKRGVCWNTKEDKTCAAHENECEVKRSKNRMCSRVTLRSSEKSCSREPGCRWVSTDTGSPGNSYMDCVSDRSIINSSGYVIPSDWPKDITSGSIQQYIREYYNNRGIVPAPRTSALMSESNRCVAPAPGEPVPHMLGMHQSVVNKVMSAIALQDTPNKGLLAYHSTGSGKTVSTVGVIDAFWNTTKNIMICTSVEGKANNPIEKFYEAAMLYFPRFQTGEYKRSSKKDTLEAFKKRGVLYMSFAEMSHFLLLHKPLKSVMKKGVEAAMKQRQHLQNGVLVIDEVHNVFKPLPNQKAENESVRAFVTERRPENMNMKVVVLTATPGDSIQDTVQLLNMVRNQGAPLIAAPDLADPKSTQAFSQSIQGLVSFFDMAGDTSKYPVVHDDDLVRAPMSNAQYEEYMRARSEVPGSSVENKYDLLKKQNQLTKYKRTSRKYSNSMFALESGVELEDFSSKLPMLTDNLMSYTTAKHYVYTAFFENRGYGGHGVHLITKTLESQLGYERFTPDDAFRLGDGLPDPKLRYIVLTGAALTSRRSKHAGQNMQALMRVFNSDENRHGKLIHAIVASQGYNEGIDLKGVRHIHLFEPLVTHAMDRQAIGRAARHCSHSQLSRSKGNWTVHVHRYFSDKPVNMTLYDPTPIQEGIQEEKQKIEQEEKKLADIKGVRGPEAKNTRDLAKKAIAEMKSVIKDAQKVLKHIERNNLNEPAMVDQEIYDEALERIKDMIQMQRLLRDAAIDCLLFKEFHKRAGIDVSCVEEA